MAGNNEFAAEGASLVRSPGFTGEDYPYWRDRFEMYVKSTQYQLWGSFRMVISLSPNQKRSMVLMNMSYLRETPKLGS